MEVAMRNHQGVIVLTNRFMDAQLLEADLHTAERQRDNMRTVYHSARAKMRVRAHCLAIAAGAVGDSLEEPMCIMRLYDAWHEYQIALLAMYDATGAIALADCEINEARRKLEEYRG